MLRAGLVTLRSQLPELVRQEFRGLLPAHHMVRRMMAQVSMDRGLDPDTLSFTASVEIIRQSLESPGLSFSP